jgi:hypothetical protein
LWPATGGGLRAARAGTASVSVRGGGFRGMLIFYNLRQPIVKHVAQVKVMIDSSFVDMSR